jgi:hypothetical protein
MIALLQNCSMLRLGAWRAWLLTLRASFAFLLHDPVSAAVLPVAMLLAALRSVPAVGQL